MTFFNKSYLLFILSLCLFISCNDDNDDYKYTVAANDIEYRGIKYFYIDTVGSNVEEEIIIPEVIFRNNTDSTFKQEVNIHSQFKDKVVFETNDSVFSYLVHKDSLFIHVPAEVRDNKIFYFTNFYQLGYIIAIPPMLVSLDTYYLSPHTQIRVRGSILEIKYKGLFEITYYNKILKTEGKIHGSWLRYLYTNFNSSAEYSGINEN